MPQCKICGKDMSAWNTEYGEEWRCASCYPFVDPVAAIRAAQAPDTQGESGEADETLAALREENARLREVLRLAWRAYGVWLPTDPPQEAWKTWGVPDQIRAALASVRPAHSQSEARRLAIQRGDDAPAQEEGEAPLDDDIASAFVAWLDGEKSNKAQLFGFHFDKGNREGSSSGYKNMAMGFYGGYTRALLAHPAPHEHSRSKARRLAIQRGDDAPVQEQTP